MTRFGLGMDLFQFSRDLSVSGICVSIIGVIGGIALIAITSVYILPYSELLYGAGAVILTIMIPYLAMWILLMNKTNKKDIPGIEKIGKVYSYISGSLEIIGLIVHIGLDIDFIVAIVSTLARSGRGHRNSFAYIYIILGCKIGLDIGAAVYLIFVCLKIHGIRVEKNKLLGAYIGFRYALFILYMIGGAILCALNGNLNWIALIVAFAFFILDIGLTAILHSIRADRENNAGTENALNNTVHCSQL